MELEDSLDGLFQWRTPFSMDAMLVDIELPEIDVGPEQAAPASHLNSSSISLWPTDPVSILLSPSHSSRTSAAAISTVFEPAGVRTPLAVNTEPSSVQTDITGFAIAALTTPISCAPHTPPVVKPKRSHGRGTANPKGTAQRKRKRKNPHELRLRAPGPKSKKNRVPTTAEHIVRERQRRDDMSAKYLILESLLPPAPKRERAVVVADTISFVGALQQKKAQLLNRRADLKIMASNNGRSLWSKRTRPMAPPRGPLGAVVNPSQCVWTKQRSSPVSASSDGVVVRVDPVLVSSAGTLSASRVQVGEEEVLMETVWNKPRPNFQSALLQAVQSMGFDVTRCSFLRLGKDCIQCVVTCSKSQVLSHRISEIQSSSTLIIGALRDMLTGS